MDIKKIIVDKIPHDCMACILKHSHDCGQMVKRQNASSGACEVKVADSRCKLREIQ